MHMQSHKITFSSIFCLVCFFMINAFDTNKSTPEVAKKVSDVCLPYKTLIQEAVEKFKDFSRTKNGIQRMSCKFRLADGKPIEKSTKIHYIDYHKAPEFGAELYSGQNISISAITIEVVYNPGVQSLMAFSRDNSFWGQKKCLLREQTNLEKNIGELYTR